MCHFDKIRRAEHSSQGRYGRGEGNWFGRKPHFADQTIISQYLRRRAILRVIAEPCEIYQYGSQGIRFEIHCNHFYQTNLNGGAKNIRTQWIDRNACERDGPLWIRGTLYWFGFHYCLFVIWNKRFRWRRKGLNFYHVVAQLTMQSLRLFLHHTSQIMYLYISTPREQRTIAQIRAIG